MQSTKYGTEISIKLPLLTEGDSFYILYHFVLRFDFLDVTAHITNNEGKILLFDKEKRISHFRISPNESEFTVLKKFDEFSNNLFNEVSMFMAHYYVPHLEYIGFSEDDASMEYLKEFDKIAPITLSMHSFVSEFTRNGYDASVVFFFSWNEFEVFQAILDTDKHKYQNVLKHHLSNLRKFNVRKIKLNKREEKMLYDLRLPLSAIKGRFWTYEYRKYLMGILIDAYKKKTGRFLIPTALMDGTNDKIDKKVLFYASAIVREKAIHRISTVIYHTYKDRGIDVQDLVDRYNKNQIEKIENSNNDMVGYYIGNATPFNVIRIISNDDWYWRHNNNDFLYCTDYSFYRDIYEAVHHKKRDIIVPKGNFIRARGNTR